MEILIISKGQTQIDKEINIKKVGHNILLFSALIGGIIIVNKMGITNSPIDCLDRKSVV